MGRTAGIDADAAGAGSIAPVDSAASASCRTLKLAAAMNATTTAAFTV
jgi:hypothetical protein